MRCAILQMGSGEVVPQRTVLQDHIEQYQFELRQSWVDTASWTKWDGLSRIALRRRLEEHVFTEAVDIWGLWKAHGRLGGRVRVPEGRMNEGRATAVGMIVRPMLDEEEAKERSRSPVVWITSEVEVAAVVKLVGCEPSFMGLTYGRQGMGVKFNTGEDMPGRTEWGGLLAGQGYSVEQGGGVMYVVTGWPLHTALNRAEKVLEAGGWNIVRAVRRRVAGGHVGSSTALVEFMVLADEAPKQWTMIIDGAHLDIDEAPLPVRTGSDQQNGRWDGGPPQRGDSRKGGQSERAGSSAGVSTVDSQTEAQWEARFQKMEAALDAKIDKLQATQSRHHQQVQSQIAGMDKRLTPVEAAVKDMSGMSTKVDQIFAMLVEGRTPCVSAGAATPPTRSPDGTAGPEEYQDASGDQLMLG